MRMLGFRLIRLTFAFFVVLILLGISLGATGFSEKNLRSRINEELRGLRTSLAQGIRDPRELERVLAIKEKELEDFYELDTPWYVRSLEDTIRVLTFDLGTARNIKSTDGSNETADIILERLPRTMLLMFTSFVIVTIIGILAGLWVGTKPDSRVDKILSVFSAVSAALPAWWLGIPFILIFAVTLQWLPAGGMYSAPPPEGGLARFTDLLRHAVLPVISLVLVSLGPYLYEVRTMTLQIAQEDFVLYARAKGFSELRIRLRYILRPAAPVIVTGLLLGLAGSFSGAIITEMVFNWPGMGSLYREAFLGTPDEGLIVSLTFVFMLLYVAVRFVLEILYLYLDPRIRY